MTNLFVADVMTRESINVKPDTNLFECAKKMVKEKVGSLLLVEKKELRGIISQRDILWAIVKKSKDNLKEVKAIEISPKKITTIRPTATVKEAIEKMKKSKFEKLPVVKNKKLLGFITTKDILNFKPEFYPELEEISKIREESKKLKRLKAKEKIATFGICEECGNRGSLYRFNGMLMCESCMNSQ